jgi:hypothetical protein
VRTHLLAVICTDRFTLRNPHCVPPRKVALRAKWKEHAIYCHSAWCAASGEIGHDIRVPRNNSSSRYQEVCEWVFIPRESEKCSASSQEALGDTGGRQRVGEGDKHSRRLFVADEFARQAGRVQDVQQGRGRAAGRSRRGDENSDIGRQGGARNRTL